MTDYWNDETSYSRGEKDRTPSTWVLNCAGMRVVVTRHIYHGPDEWLLTCPPYFNVYLLHSKDIELAKAEALARVNARLKATLAELLKAQP